MEIVDPQIEEIKHLKEEEQRCYFCNHKRMNHASWQSNACCYLISSVSSGRAPRDCKCPCSVYGNPDTGMPEYYPIRGGIIDKSDEETMLKFKNMDRRSILDEYENLKQKLKEK